MSLKGPLQPKPVYDAMKIQKIFLKPREAGCSHPILACSGCCLQLCPQGQEPQQEGASRRHSARAVAGTELGSNLKFLPSSPGPGTGGSGSQVTCRNLPHFAVILFSKELLQLPLSTHGQGSSRIQSRPHTAGSMVRGQRGQCRDGEDGVCMGRVVWGQRGWCGDGEGDRGPHVQGCGFLPAAPEGPTTASRGLCPASPPPAVPSDKPSSTAPTTGFFPTCHCFVKTTRERTVVHTQKTQSSIKDEMGHLPALGSSRCSGEGV